MEKGQTKRLHLLSTGLGILHERGYNGTSIGDIVKEAGVPKGSFYFYFNSKEDFALEVIDHYATETNDELVTLLQEDGRTPKERLMNFYTRKVSTNIDRLQCNKGCLISNIASEMSDSNEVIRSKTMYHFNLALDMIASVIQEGQLTGEVKIDEEPRALAAAIEDAWKGALNSMKACKCAKPLEHFTDITLKYLLK